MIKKSGEKTGIIGEISSEINGETNKINSEGYGGYEK